KDRGGGGGMGREGAQRPHRDREIVFQKRINPLRQLFTAGSPPPLRAAPWRLKPAPCSGAVSAAPSSRNGRGAAKAAARGTPWSKSRLGGRAVGRPGAGLM